MNNTLYIGFKGKNNSSAILVNSLPGQHCLLTNSYAGLKREIDMLSPDYNEVYLFGADKNLSDSFRIEQYAEKDCRQMATILDLNALSERLSASGIKSSISKTATHYLCNEAYWHLLEKYRGRAVLIHIPTIKHFITMVPTDEVSHMFIGDDGTHLVRHINDMSYIIQGGSMIDK